MHRYFFNTDQKRDVEGVELASLEAAKCEAIKYAGCIVCEQAEALWDRTKWSVTVTDETGRTLFTLQIIGEEAAAMPSVVPAAQHAG